MKKKIYFPNPHDIEVTGPDLRRQFRKNQNFCFYGSKGAGEFRGHEKIKNPQPSQHRSHRSKPVTSMWENLNFCFYGPKGPGRNLWASLL